MDDLDGRALAALLAGVAVLALAGCGGGKEATPCPGASMHLGALRLTVPHGFKRYDLRGGIYPEGTRPPVIGVVVTDYRLKAHSPLRIHGFVPVPPHENRVILTLGRWFGLGPEPPPGLRLPISLDQHWVSRRFAHGTRRYGFFRFRGQLYEVFFWAGRAAPTHDRKCVRQALMSIQGAGS